MIAIRNAILSSSDTLSGLMRTGTAQWSTWLGVGASVTSKRLLTALALATSVACAATFLISSSVTNGLLAKPQTPL